MKIVIAGRAGGVELVVGGAVCSGVSSLTGAGVSVMCWDGTDGVAAPSCLLCLFNLDVNHRQYLGAILSVRRDFESKKGSSIGDMTPPRAAKEC